MRALHFLCTRCRLLLLLEMAILGLMHRKHDAFRLFDQSCDCLVHTIHCRILSCILQPNNKRRTSFCPPVSLSLRSEARCKLGNGIASGVKEKERCDTKKDER